METPMQRSRSTYAPQDGQPLSAQYASSPFHCALCSRDFAHETALQNHLITSQAHRKAKIRTTQLNSQLIGLTHHPKIETSSHVGYRKNPGAAAHCSVCDRDFVTEGALTMHVEYSETHQNRQDAIAKAIVAKSTRETVVISKNVAPNKYPHCGICNRGFVDSEALAMHVKHSENHRNWSNASAKDIAKVSQETALKSFHCSVCNRVFVNSEAFAMHIKHSEAHRNQNNASVKVVAKVGQETALKSFHCSVCNRDFVNSEALAMHIEHSEAHRNQNNASANVITKASQEPSPKNDIPAKSFHCDICNRAFVNGQAFAMHVKDSTDHRKRNGTAIGAVANGVGKPVSCKNDISSTAAHCSVCSRDFVNGEALRMHIEHSKDHQKKNMTVMAIAKDCQETSAPRNDVLPRIIIQSPPISTLRVIEAATPGTLQEQPTHILGHSQSNGCLSDRDVPLHIGSPWSEIPQREWLETLRTLSQKCHSLEILSKNGYRVRECTQDEMDKLRKCRNCGDQQKKIESSASTDCVFHPQKPTQPQLNLNGNVSNDEPAIYPCCEDTGRGCTVNLKHEYAPLDPFTKFRLRSYAYAPTHAHLKRGKRSAIALDCEMAGVIGGFGEVVRLCAVDYISGEVLIDSLVVPAEKIVQWRTRYSGVTPAMLAGARARGQALKGWQGARAELWKYMDADTILIGQSLHNDLSALRMVHTCVVDSAILTKMAVSPDCSRSWSLKTLSNVLLDLEIQTGKHGHDCLEDTLATREVVLECNRNPQKLEAWADNERMSILEEKEKREQGKRGREGKHKEDTKEKVNGNGGRLAHIGSNDQGDLLLSA